MEKGTRVVAYVCILNVLFTGCYSSAMVDPAGNNNDKMYTDNIEFVITKDGTKYVFEIPATIVKGSIVGTSGARQVSIPVAEVSKVYVTKPNPAGTTFLVLGIAAGAVLIYAIASAGFFFGEAGEAINKSGH